MPVTGWSPRTTRASRATSQAHHAEPPDTIAADLLAIADSAGVDRFAYYGYPGSRCPACNSPSARTGSPPLRWAATCSLGGPYGPMLDVTRSAHRQALANRDNLPEPVELQPGDWESPRSPCPRADPAVRPAVRGPTGLRRTGGAGQAHRPRLAFAGENDVVAYGPKWNNARVEIAEPPTHAAELTERGWTVVLIPDTDHMSAMDATTVLPVLPSG